MMVVLAVMWRLHLRTKQQALQAAAADDDGDDDDEEWNTGGLSSSMYQEVV